MKKYFGNLGGLVGRDNSSRLGNNGKKVNTSVNDDSADLTTSTQSFSSSDTIEIITAKEELFDQAETIFVKLPQGKLQTQTLKIEHFDDLIQDNSFQSTWAGLDDFLVDEEFLYLEDEEADRIYMQLKQRQSRRKNIEQTEQAFQSRIRAYEELAKASKDQQKDEVALGQALQASTDFIKHYTKNFSDGDKLDFTQNMLNFANTIEKKYLVEGLVMSLSSFAEENPKIKMALLDQFIPLIQLVQEKCSQSEQDCTAKEIFRLLDQLLYDQKDIVRERAIEILYDIRSVVQNDDKEYIMNLTLKLAHDSVSANKVHALKLLNKFAQDMGQTLCECFIVPEVKSLALETDEQVRIAVARNLINISKIVSFEYFQNQIFPLYEELTKDSMEKVRKTCADQVAEIAKVSSIEKQAKQLSGVYYRFLKDPSSKLVRGTAFQNIGPFIAAFKKGQDIDQQIIDFYVQTTESSNNKDVCYHASFNFPAFVLVFGSEEWPRFQSLYHKLTKFQDARIKKTLAASTHELAKILGPKYTELDLLPCFERFLQDKDIVIKMAALKNLHTFLKEVSLEKRQMFIKYIFAFTSDIKASAKPEWRLKHLLAQNLGNYVSLFDSKTVYAEFLPMFFSFLSDNVTRVAQAVCPAMSDIIQKFNDDEQKQIGIVRYVKKKFVNAKTFKKRQFFIQMVTGPTMMQKDNFEKYFKFDLLSLVGDKVVNVRIALAKALRHHFLKEIAGEFVYDKEVNDAVRVLKQDSSAEVQSIVQDIETYDTEQLEGKNSQITLEQFLQNLKEIQLNTTGGSDTFSITSEDEQKIESEIHRHNSEDEIDHGPVLRSLRQAREKQNQEEEEIRRLEREEKKKAKNKESVDQILNDLTDETSQNKSEVSEILEQ